MIQVTVEVDQELSITLENYFSEHGGHEWALVNATGDDDSVRESECWHLTGYFPTQEEAGRQWQLLRDLEPRLPATPLFTPLNDCDWATAYRQHYRAWNIGTLHWVPEWHQGQYLLPEGERALYLDPGMAFGMCDHPTTRLCLMALWNYYERWRNVIAEKTLIDVGCGSGILSLSAALLGFGSVYGFDCDPIAIRVSRENAEKNQLSERVIFECREIAGVFPQRTADVILANQLSGVLRASSEVLLSAVRPGGILAISGILAAEQEAMREHYDAAQAKWGDEFSRVPGCQEGWHGITFTRQ